MIKNLSGYCVSPTASIREVIEVINKNQSGIAIVSSADDKLMGTITDGDIRRFLLKNKSLDEACTTVMYKTPTVANDGTSSKEIRQLMEERELQNIPIVDKNMKLMGLVRYRELIKDADIVNTAVIMAGGEGRRLRPLTDNVPKPMVMIGDKPILKNIIQSLKQSGVTKIYMAVNYLSEVIEEYFGDGSDHGVEITYIHEEIKMGTAGALSLLPEVPDKPFLVLNGDIVSEVNFSSLLDFHKRHRSLLTVAASEYHFKIPYGVLDIAGHYVLGVEEKPSKKFFCNAGIYTVSPELLRYIPKNKEFNMTDLLNVTVQEGYPTTVFPIHEYWVDVGQKEDLMRAISDHKQLSQ